MREVHVQDVHLSPLAEFEGISAVDPADVKASVFHMDRTYYQVWREAVWHLRRQKVELHSQKTPQNLARQLH